MARDGWQARRARSAAGSIERRRAHRGAAPRRRLAVGALVVLLGLLGPATFGAPVAALAAGSGGQSALTSTSNPLAPATIPSSTTTSTAQTTVNTSTSSGGGGISTGSAIGIAIAAFVIIVGIAAAIFVDARRRTRDRHLPSADAERVPGSKRPPKARKLSPAERRRRKRGRAPRRR